MFRIGLMLLILSPCSAFAISTLEVEYAFTAPEESVVESYKLYMDGAIVCTTTDIADDRFECDIEVPAGVSFFTLSAVFADDTESPQSPAYRWYTHKKMFLRVAGALIKIKSDND